MFHRFKLLKLIAFYSLVFTLLASPAFAQAANNNKTAQQVVEEGIAVLSEILATAEATYAADPEELYQQINTAMQPFVDFRYMSAKVMGGAYFRAATPKQRRDFAEVFENTLIKTFAKGLLSFNYKEFNFLANQEASRYENQDQIHLEVVATDNKRYPVTFMLRFANKEWKLVNIIVNGINLGLTFNSQFEEAMRANQRNFDLVIANWNPEAAIKEVETGNAK